MSLTLYEIDAALLACVDLETGEILDIEAFRGLQMERDAKIENMALWIKNLDAEAKAIREEELALADRRKAKESKAESLRAYLGEFLEGKKFSTARVSLSYRSSEAVEIPDEDAFIGMAIERGEYQYLSPQPPKIDRKAVKDAIKNGKEVEVAVLVKRSNLQLK